MHQRVCQKLDDVRSPLTGYSMPLTQIPGLVWRFFRHGLWPGGPRRLYYFALGLRKAGLNYPRLETLMDGWISSLALQSFVRQRFS